MSKRTKADEGDPHVDVIVHESSPESVDEFADLFDSTDGVPFVVRLFREEPEVWQGVTIKGYICELEPGTTLEAIKKRYGGGRYKVDKRNALGRIIVRRSFDVSPFVPKMENDDGKRSTAVIPLAEQPMIDVQGVKIPVGQTEAIQQLVLWTKAVNVMFPQTLDPNSQLLATLIDIVREKSAPPGDPLDLLAKLRMAVPEIFERPSDGSSLYSVLQEAIRQAGSVLTGARVLPGKVKLLQGTPSRVGKADPVSSEPTPNNEEPMADNTLMLMLGEVIKAFRLDPPKEPPRVVAMLDLLFPMKREDRVNIKQVRERAFDIAENQLSEDFAENPELREQFRQYYDQVFDTFVDPERVAGGL
jgi:hypothetical protein